MRSRKTTRLLCGVGINDADYDVTLHDAETGKKIIWSCPYWEKWRSMIKRCYSKNYSIRNPTYKGCSVCKEWHLFSNFKSWMEQQDWEGKHLDKDLRVSGNKVYSPETCALITPKLNTFLAVKQNKNQKHNIGVYRFVRPKWNIREFMCKIQNGTGKQQYIGVFHTEIEAHNAWQKEKLKQAKEILKGQDNKDVITGLCRVINKLHYEIENSLVTYIL